MRTPCKRLMRAMQYAALLSRGEAEACVRDLRRGDNYSGEAVNHYGGTRAVLDAAIKLRHHLRTTYSV